MRATRALGSIARVKRYVSVGPVRGLIWGVLLVAAVVGVGYLVIGIVRADWGITARSVIPLVMALVAGWQLKTRRLHPGVLLALAGVALIAADAVASPQAALAGAISYAVFVTAAGYFLSRRWNLLLIGLLIAGGVVELLQMHGPRPATEMGAAVMIVSVAAGSVLHDRTAAFMRNAAYRREALFANAADAILLFNETLRVVDANTQAASMFGFASPPELIGRGLATLIPSRFRDNHADYVGRFAASSRRRHVLADRPLYGLRANGDEFPFEATISKVPIDGKTHFMTIMRDVTEREQAHRRLQEMAEARVRLVASVSHEIRTPLSAVLGFAEVLNTDTSALPEQERQDLIGEIAGQAREMSNLIEDLLVGARTELGELSVARVPVDLKAQAAQVIEQTLTGPVLIEGEAVALGDPQRVRQIIRNLVTNAERHGGPDIRLHLASEGDLVSLTVSDNGPGIEADLRRLIFEPFTSFTSVGGTTDPIGLGLSVVKQLAHVMGGSIDYYHEFGTSSFILTLPAAK